MVDIVSRGDAIDVVLNSSTSCEDESPVEADATSSASIEVGDVGRLSSMLVDRRVEGKVTVGEIMSNASDEDVTVL